MRIWTDKLMRVVVVTTGVAVVFMVFALLGYLGKESQYAFAQKYGYGFRFALQPHTLPAEYSLDTDVLASVLKCNQEGADGLDEKEEVAPFPTLEDVRASAYEGFEPVGAIGTTLVDDVAKIDPTSLWKEDWRPSQGSSEGEKFLFFAYCLPEWNQPTFKLRWQEEDPFDSRLSPHELRLTLVRAPAGVDVEKINVDLKAKPNGEIELPTFRAETDEQRTEGYLFALESKAATNPFMATATGFFKHSWDGTLTYPRYGMWPLLLTTVVITLLSLLIAVPLSVSMALYLSDVAPIRVREVLKPIIELLASVPTVVLGYFGLNMIAPGVQSALTGTIFAPESGRNLFTAALVLGFLLIPIITTFTEDALRSVPDSLRDGGAALGLTKVETLQKIILPGAKAGIIGAVLLGAARAFGETMIIWMLAGGTATTPNFSSLANGAKSLTQSARGIPDAIGIDMANVTFEEAHYGHLFLLGVMLFGITLAINLIGYRMAKRGAAAHG